MVANHRLDTASTLVCGTSGGGGGGVCSVVDVIVVGVSLHVCALFALAGLFQSEIPSAVMRPRLTSSRDACAPLATYWLTLPLAHALSPPSIHPPPLLLCTSKGAAITTPCGCTPLMTSRRRSCSAPRSASSSRMQRCGCTVAAFRVGGGGGGGVGGGGADCHCYAAPQGKSYQATPISCPLAQLVLLLGLSV